MITTKNRHWRHKERQPAVSWTIGPQDGRLSLVHAEPEGFAARVGQSTTDAILACVEANPGVGKNIIHAKVGGRKQTVLDAIDELVRENLLDAEASLRGGYRYTKKGAI